MLRSTRRFPRPLGAVVVGGAAVALAALAGPAAANAASQGTRTASDAGSISAGTVRSTPPSGRTHTKGSFGTLSTIAPESVIGTDGRTRVTDTTVYPASAIGQIEFIQNGSAFICTGWLIDKNTVLTSGHCSFNADGGTGDIIESATFTAGRNKLVDPYGTCPVYEVYAPPEWTSVGDPKYDFSIMQLGTNNAGTITTCDVGTTAGYFGISWTAGADALTGNGATVQGYPGDKAFGTQWTMSGNIKKSTKLMVFYRMDTAGGQSGSPVFDATGAKCGGTPCGMAVHSYGVGLPGPGANANAGPRITQGRFTTITNYAVENG
jgi:glutamyl endopeptidase